jgi:hypothetical protein
MRQRTAAPYQFTLLQVLNALCNLLSAHHAGNVFPYGSSARNVKFTSREQRVESLPGFQ